MRMGQPTPPPPPPFPASGSDHIPSTSPGGSRTHHHLSSWKAFGKAAAAGASHLGNGHHREDLESLGSSQSSHHGSASSHFHRNHHHGGGNGTSDHHVYTRALRVTWPRIMYLFLGLILGSRLRTSEQEWAVVLWSPPSSSVSKATAVSANMSSPYPAGVGGMGMLSRQSSVVAVQEEQEEGQEQGMDSLEQGKKKNRPDENVGAGASSSSKTPPSVPTPKDTVAVEKNNKGAQKPIDKQGAGDGGASSSSKTPPAVPASFTSKNEVAVEKDDSHKGPVSKQGTGDGGASSSSQIPPVTQAASTPKDAVAVEKDDSDKSPISQQGTGGGGAANSASSSSKISPPPPSAVNSTSSSAVVVKDAGDHHRTGTITSQDESSSSWFDTPTKVVLLPGPHKAGSTSLQTCMNEWVNDHKYVEGWSWPIPSKNEIKALHIRDWGPVKGFAILAFASFGEPGQNKLKQNNDAQPVNLKATIQLFSKTAAKAWHGGANLVYGSEEMDRAASMLPFADATADHSLGILPWNNGTDRPLLRRDVEVVINFRSPRVDHLRSIWHQHGKPGNVMQNSTFREFLTTRSNECHITNSFLLALKYLERGIKATIVNMSGMKEEKRQLCHVVACDVMKANTCTSAGRLGQVADVKRAKDNALGDPPGGLNMTDKEMAEIDRILVEYDCGLRDTLLKYEKSSQLRFLFRHEIFRNCPAHSEVRSSQWLEDEILKIAKRPSPSAAEGGETS